MDLHTDYSVLSHGDRLSRVVASGMEPTGSCGLEL